MYSKQTKSKTLTIIKAESPLSEDGRHLIISRIWAINRLGTQDKTSEIWKLGNYAQNKQLLLPIILSQQTTSGIDNRTTDLQLFQFQRKP